MKIRTSQLMLKVKLRPILATVLAGLGGMLPYLVWAAADATTQGASTGPNLSGVGKVLGMVLFGYLVMKWANRRKSSEDDEPRGFLGQKIKPVYVWLVLILGLIVLMSRTG